MISFEYSARDANTKQIVKGVAEAESKAAAGKLLIQQGLTPIEINAKDNRKNILNVFGNHVSSKDRIIFTRQLATLISAGLPLAQGLRTVADQTASKPLKLVISEIVSSVEGGNTLANSFAKHPKVFNDTFVALVAAGEVSGTLAESLERIANQQEKDAEIMRKIRGALVYPAIVVAVIIGVIIFMMTAVVPQVKQLYKDLGKSLPWLTAGMVAISDFLIKFWYILVVILAIAIFMGYRFSKTDAGKSFFDDFKMRVPLFGGMFKKMYMARFCRIGGTLMKAGIPIIEMLNVSARAVNNVHITSDIQNAGKKVQGGKALSVALAACPTILPLVPQMIGIGEKSGSIDAMMDKAATYYENELDESIRTISASIEPILMVFLALVAGLMVGAILLPIYGLVGQNLAL